MVIFFGRFVYLVMGKLDCMGRQQYADGSAVDSFIYFADIQPEYQWACIDDVIVYAFAMPRKDEICVTFWNSKSNERFAKYVRGLIGICRLGTIAPSSVKLP